MKTESNINDVTFSLRDGAFESAITDTYNIVTSPSRRLMTGMQGLNEMVGGGFESGRVYMFLGTSGVGKSVTLLNLLYQNNILLSTMNEVLLTTSLITQISNITIYQPK